MSTSIRGLDADKASDLMDKTSGQRLALASTQPSSRADRIMAVCPGCQATLSVRRVYIGNDVQCKQCGHIFPIAAPADTQSKPLEDSKNEQLLDEHGTLMAGHGQLHSEDEQLEVEHCRLASAQDQLGEQLGPVTSELNAIRKSSGERLVGPSAERFNRADRIVAVCPGCQAILSVRRAYFGSDVKCKHCGHKFPIAAPADTQSKPVEDRKHEQLLDEHGWLTAVYGTLQPTHDQLEIEDGQVAPARDELDEQLGPITSEPNAIRTSSGEQSAGPAAQRSSRADRIAAVCPGCQATLRVRQAYFGSDVKCKHCGHIFPIAAPADSQSEPLEHSKNEQLLDEIGRLMAEHGQLQAKYDQLDGQLKERETELTAASTKRDLLIGQLKAREIDLDTARAECSRLSREQQTAADEIKALQMALAERDSALRDQSEQLGAHGASYQQALDHAEHVHGAMIASLEGQLAVLDERFGRLQDEYRSTQELCKQFQNRELELTEAQKRLESAHQSKLDAERMKQAELAKQLDELRALAAERTGLAEQLIAANSRRIEERSAADTELTAASTKLDLLIGQLKAREIDLDTARAECSRLSREQQTAADEIKALQMALAERDSALRDQSEQLGAHGASYQQALDHAEHVHGAMIASLEAQLAALNERFGRLHDEHRSTQELCKQFQDRELELTEAQKRLESTHQSKLDAERMKQAELAKQLDELRALAAERAGLAEQLIAANSRRIEERSAANTELKAASTNLDLLIGQLKEREIDLDTARAECNRLTCEQQTAADELKVLRITLAERDSALRDQSEELGAQVENHRQALDHAEQVHEAKITALEGQLAVLDERFGRLQDEYRSTQELCKQFQNRELELTEAQKRLESTHQSKLGAERMKQAELAKQLDELRALAAEHAGLAEQLIAANSRQVEERSASDAELEAARAQVRELNLLLSKSERLNRETAAVLNGIGIRVHSPVSN